MSSCADIQAFQSFSRVVESAAGEESTKVGDDVIEGVMEKIYDTGVRDARRNTDDKKLTEINEDEVPLRARVSDIMQDNRSRTAASHDNIEERLRLMFIAAQEPFEQVKMA